MQLSPRTGSLTPDIGTSETETLKNVPELNVRNVRINHSTASSKSQRRFNTAAFTSTDETVRSIVDDSCPVGGDAPTAFQALAALFWASISRAKGSTRGMVDISVCVDTRGALGLSKSFFGNALAFNGVPGGGVEEGRLDMAAKAVADAMINLDKPDVMGLIE
ncbi:hypothetical protein Taro_052603 [Colocasia esculenta]|uniref:Uncharacterized protein n=1 Tax=Colocasia esculenta TaxID=4460 RepID=A0A843XKK6_COLES|nr:hypothetical protein [Colocasia esculenta]